MPLDGVAFSGIFNRVELQHIRGGSSNFFYVGRYTPLGGYSQYTWLRGRGSDRVSNCKPKKTDKPEIIPKKYLASKFSTQKIQDWNTSILIFSIKQTFRPKNIHHRSYDPPKTPRVEIFNPKTIYVGLPSCVLWVPPKGILLVSYLVIQRCLTKFWGILSYQSVNVARQLLLLV